MRRTGFVYLMFAIAVMGLLVVAITIPINIEAGDTTSASRIGVDELFYFVESIRSDMERAIDITGRRAMVAIANDVVTSGAYLDTAPGPAIAMVAYNGSFNGTEYTLLDDTALVDWVAKMESQAGAEGYSSDLVVDVDSMAAEQDGPFAVRFSFAYNLSVYDPAIETGFNRTDRRFSAPVTIDGLEDPLIYVETAGRRSRSVRRCGVEPADHVLTGDSYAYNRTYEGEQRNWTGGTSAVTPGTVADLDPDAVAFVDDHCSFAESDLDDLAGVVSGSDDSCGYGGELTGLVTGVDNVSRVTDDRRVVLDDATVHELGIPRMIDTGCFVSDPTGPSYLDRLTGTNGPSTGIVSLLDVPELPDEVQYSGRTAVDHGYFNITDLGSVSRIKGVTDTEEGWFRLDEEHVEQWNLTSLTYTP